MQSQQVLEGVVDPLFEPIDVIFNHEFILIELDIWLSCSKLADERLLFLNCDCISAQFFLVGLDSSIKFKLLLTMLFLGQFHLLKFTLKNFSLLYWCFAVFTLAQQLFHQRLGEILCLRVWVDR